MDWSKAKNIIIIALIATNIFLLLTYITKNQTNKLELDQETLFAVLENKNIFVETELPTNYPKLPAITVEYENNKQESIKANLFKTIYDVSPQAETEEYEKAANRFLIDCDLLNDNITLEGVFTEGDKTIVKYINCYKGVTIGDSFVVCEFVKGKLENVERHGLNPVGQSKKNLDIISPGEALLILMSEKENDEKIFVENIELVFWVNNSSFEGETLISDTAFPTWEITYNDDKKQYIEAYKT